MTRDENGSVKKRQYLLDDTEVAKEKVKLYKEEAYKAQGFNTIGSGHSGAAFNLSGSALNTERVWQDLGAPQWGTPAK